MDLERKRISPIRAAYLVEVDDTDRGHPWLNRDRQGGRDGPSSPFDLEISLARWWFRP